MRCQDVTIVGMGVELGEYVPSAEATASGLFNANEAAATGQISTSRADLPAVRLAVRAGRTALLEADTLTSRAGGRNVPSSSLGLHLHASACSSGIEGWSASCYVLNELVDAGPMLSLQLNALSNSSLAAVELAAHAMTADKEMGYVLVTVADRFTEADFPRWSSHSGLVLGDGAVAAVVGRGVGVASLVSIASFTDPRMEALHRGDEEIIGGGTPHVVPIELSNRGLAHLEKIGGAREIQKRFVDALSRIVEKALSDAGLTMSGIARIVLPFFGRELITDQYLTPLEISEERTLLDFGLRHGHLGGADQLVGLHHLISTGVVRRGEYVMLVGAGAGFTWTIAVVQVS